MRRQHGSRTRGIEAIPQATSYEGRFGRMFRSLPTFQQSDEFLLGLAEGMRQPETEVTDNPNLPAGYTYLGQFIDHDITFDPSSIHERQNDPEGLRNYRSPRLDLDSLYGSGPADEPFQYDQNVEGAMLIGKGKNPPVPEGADTTEDDLPRNAQGRALIGDPRNDENIIVSQLHLAFLKLHNKFVEQVRANQNLTGENLFKEAQRLTRFHYQWVVVHDFLGRIVGEDVVNSILRPPDESGRREVKLRFYRPKVEAFIPVEFSIAAYRFGHSLVRPLYRLSEQSVTGVPELPIFAQSENPGPLEDFHGFRHLPANWTIDWNFFFDLNGQGSSRQKAQLIDTKLAEGLFKLPGRPPEMESLALLNLKRGRELALPSGRRVATAMRIPEDQKLGEAELGFNEPAPLWFYVLKEAYVRRGGQQLGPVGGGIVAEVLLGLLARDPLSWINVEPTWQPTIPDADGDGRITMADLLKFAVPNQTQPPVTPPNPWGG